MKNIIKTIGKRILLCIISFGFLESCSSTSEIKGGIAEFREIELGGLKQTILIRGNDVSNPILLFLHGGPGSSELVPFRVFHEELEKYFTIVSWEQRGAGKSYRPDIPIETMTFSQFVEDAHELSSYLLNEFHKDKILIVAHSAGSILGTMLINKYPELFFGYVAIGQVVNQDMAEKISYQYCLDNSKDNPDAQSELKRINEPEPYLTMDANGAWYDKLITQRKWLVKLGGELYQKSDYSTFINDAAFAAPEYTLFDWMNYGSASSFSLKNMWPEVMKVDFKTQFTEVSIPVFFFQGRHDYTTASSLVEDFYNGLIAPQKELVWFENSAHLPMFEEPELFQKMLIEKVLPICK